MAAYITRKCFRPFVLNKDTMHAKVSDRKLVHEDPLVMPEVLYALDSSDSDEMVHEANFINMTPAVIMLIKPIPMELLLG